jgi:thiol-disulfide isomerase/thioredoxin
MDQDASGWKTLLTRANQLVRSATHPAAELPVEGHLPGFDGATGWLNSPPLTAAGLRGQVVLVQFWTYTCINWLRTLAAVRGWADRYRDQGLVVVGVHTPEFDFEHDPDNVRRAVTDLGVDYPVAVDSDYGIWTAFANRYWPASYFVDAQGQLRHHRFGEGDEPLPWRRSARPPASSSCPPSAPTPPGSPRSPSGNGNPSGLPGRDPLRGDR